MTENVKNLGQICKETFRKEHGRARGAIVAKNQAEKGLCMCGRQERIRPPKRARFKLKNFTFECNIRLLFFLPYLVRTVLLVIFYYDRFEGKINWMIK